MKGILAVLSACSYTRSIVSYHLNMPFVRDVLVRTLVLLANMTFTFLSAWWTFNNLRSCLHEHCTLISWVSFFGAPQLYYVCICSHLEDLKYIWRNIVRVWRNEMLPEDDPFLQHRIGAHQ